jgi:hypothetical protein
MASLLLFTAHAESQTYDEGMHLASGYTYWKTGDFSSNPERPPLSKLLAAAPLILLNPDLPKQGPPLDRAWQFVYENRVSAETILLTGRCTIALVTIAFGFALAEWTRRTYSKETALLALAFYATDPNWIAHGKYVTSDVLVSAAFFAAAMSWDRALRSGLPWRETAIASIWLAAALSSKFSAQLLIPLHAIAALLYWRGTRFDPVRLLAALAGAGVIVALSYGPDTFRRHGPLAGEIHGNSPGAVAARQVANDYRLPAHPYLYGIAALGEHVESGHASYLRGQLRTKGDWLYFPLAFAVKTPTALLIGIAGAAVFLRRPQPWMLYPAGYLLVSIWAGLNIGLRHLLPVYPFLFVIVAATFAHHIRRAIPPLFSVFAVAALSVHIFETARVHPYYTAFFNSIAGGAEGGRRYLLDSNLDWGQDAKRLGEFAARNRLDKLCVSYFGTALLHRHGVPAYPVPDERNADFDCVTAVSANSAAGLYLPPSRHPWIRGLKPDFTIGYSILIYDLRRDRTVQLLR